MQGSTIMVSEPTTSIQIGLCLVKGDRAWLNDRQSYFYKYSTVRVPDKNLSFNSFRWYKIGSTLPPSIRHQQQHLREFYQLYQKYWMILSLARNIFHRLELTSLYNQRQVISYRVHLFYSILL